jgi:hypothetical protein
LMQFKYGLPKEIYNYTISAIFLTLFGLVGKN